MILQLLSRPTATVGLRLAKAHKRRRRKSEKIFALQCLNLCSFGLERQYLRRLCALQNHKRNKLAKFYYIIDSKLCTCSLHQFDIIVINTSVVDQKASKIFQDDCIYKKSLQYGAAAV